MIDKIQLHLIFFILLLFSCQSKNRVEENKNSETREDIKLIEDFNFDKHLDTLKIIKTGNENSDLVIALFGNRNLVISKKIIFQNRKLYSEENKSIINIEYKNKTIILNQEYGSSSPEGWYICYINYNLKSKKFIVDSIEHSWKNFNAKSDSDFIKSKTKILAANLENFDADLEFHNLK